MDNGSAPWSLAITTGKLLADKAEPFAGMFPVLVAIVTAEAFRAVCKAAVATPVVFVAMVAADAFRVA